MNCRIALWALLVGPGLLVSAQSRVRGSTSTPPTNGQAPAAPPFAIVDLSPTTIRGVSESLALAISNDGSQIGGRGYIPVGSGQPHAILWPGSAPTAVDLTPANFIGAEVLSSNGSQQVGDGYSATPGVGTHALLWSGTAASAVDLNPTNLSGITNSYAIFTNGTQQVGEGGGHALLWNGTANSAVDLNPTNLTGVTGSRANTMIGSQIFGLGSVNSHAHAMMWSNGTANSAVDLNPTNLPGITDSDIYGAGGGQQVGWGSGPPSSGVQHHALVWSGRADNVVDLTPPGYTDAIASDTNGSEQVGYASQTGTGIEHALLWTGTAASAVDLTQFLPVKFWSSQAFAIDAVGDIVGVATDGANVQHAVVWHIPVAGDANLDGTVDFSDLLILAQHYGPQGGAVWQSGDFNGDGNVNFADLLPLAQNYGRTVFDHTQVAALAVPEPSSSSALLIAAALTRLKRRTRRGRLQISPLRRRAALPGPHRRNSPDFTTSRP